MAKFGIGDSVRRVEDPRLLTGGGRYTDDTKLGAPAARMYVLRSPHAHADITRIDTAAAAKAAGVLLILTGKDVKKADFGDVPCLVPLENRDGTPRGAICEYDAKDDRSTLWVSSQGVSMIRPVVADMILKIGSPKLRVRTGDVGGGFGMKIFVHPEYPMIVWASRTLKRTVKWIPDRQEAFQSDVQGRDHVSIAEMALDGDAKFLGCRITTYAALGAYLNHFSVFIPTLAGSSMLNGLYTTPAIYVNVKGVMTNTVPTDAYRGAGRPEAAYLMERFVDHIAREVGLAPDDLRARNFITPR